MKVFRGKLESACLSVCLSICVQNTSVCQSASGGIKSHLVRALVFSKFKIVVFKVLLSEIVRVDLSNYS